MVGSTSRGSSRPSRSACSFSVSLAATPPRAAGFAPDWAGGALVGIASPMLYGDSDGRGTYDPEERLVGGALDEVVLFTWEDDDEGSYVRRASTGALCDGGSTLPAPAGGETVLWVGAWWESFGDWDCDGEWEEWDSWCPDAEEMEWICSFPEEAIDDPYLEHCLELYCD